MKNPWSGVATNSYVTDDELKKAMNKIPRQKTWEEMLDEGKAGSFYGPRQPNKKEEDMKKSLYNAWLYGNG